MIKDNKLIGKLAIVGILLIFLVSLVLLVSALTPQEEISQLESEISGAGFGWLNEYSGSDLYSKIEAYPKDSENLKEVIK